MHEPSDFFERGEDGRMRVRCGVTPTNAGALFGHRVLGLRDHGMVLPTTEAIPLGTPVDVQLRLGDEVVETSGFVVYVQRPEQGREGAVGIRFTTLTALDWQRLAGLVPPPVSEARRPTAAG